MGKQRSVLWAIVVITVYLPISWSISHFTEVPATSSVPQLLFASLVSWTISGALAFFLVKSAKGIRILKEERAAALEKLVAEPLRRIRPRQALLQDGEIAYSSMRATLREVQAVGYTSGNAGISVRVMKGVSIRSGATRGHSVKAAVSVSSGEVVITDRRVIFAGDAKSFAIPLSKLINVTNYVDGIAFHEDHRSYLLIGSDGSENEIFTITVMKVLQLRREQNEAPLPPIAV